MSEQKPQLVFVVVTGLAVILVSWLSSRSPDDKARGSATEMPLYMHVNGQPVYRHQRHGIATEVRLEYLDLSSAQIDARVKDLLVEMVVLEQQAQTLGVVVPQDEVDTAISAVRDAAATDPVTIATALLDELERYGYASLDAYLAASEGTYRQALLEEGARGTLEAQATVATPSPEEIRSAIQPMRGQVGLLAATFDGEDAAQAEQFKQELLAQVQGSGLHGAIVEIAELFNRYVGTPIPNEMGGSEVGTTYDLGQIDSYPPFVAEAAEQPVGHVGLVESGEGRVVYVVLSKAPDVDPTAVISEMMNERRAEAVRQLLQELSAAAAITMVP